MHYLVSNNLRSAIETVRKEGAKVETDINNVLNEVNELSGSLSPPPRIEGFEYTLSEAAKIKKNSEYIGTGALSFEIARFVWLWLQILATGVSFALCLMGFYGSNKGLLIGGNTMLFMLFIGLFLHMAYASSELFVILDVCEQVYEVVHKNKLPYTESGMAYFLVPFDYV